MFSALRQNTTIYILTKGEKPTLKEAQVEAVSQPKPKFGAVYNPLGMDTMVDVKAKVGDDILEFQNLPSQQTIATYNGNTVVSEDKVSMTAEVEAMLRSSKQILESQPYHQQVAESCEAILKQLNPQLKKEAEQEERISKMEGKIDEMYNYLKSLNAKTT